MDYQQLAKEIENNTIIDREFYNKYNVMRGLRYRNGTGVLVGITRIASVQGYQQVNDRKVPVDGSLYYRGYNLHDFVEDVKKTQRFGYEEVSYLLLFGNLPNEQELQEFNHLLVEARKLPEGFLEDMILRRPSRNIMNSIMRAVLGLYTYDDQAEKIDTEQVLIQSISLIAKIPVLMAYAYQAKRHKLDGDSLIIRQPLPHYNTAENILHLIRKDAKFTQEEARILDLLLVLHAEHGGGNNSTFATHVVTSTGTDTYSAMATALGSLKGPRHGGANIKVGEMLEDIRKNIQSIDNEREIESYLQRMLNREVFDKCGLIYGMGHAVYTLKDPRSEMLKQQAKELAKIKDREEDFQFVEAVERIAGRLIQEAKGLAHPVCSNVDLYSGLVYQLLKIPQDLFTPLFAASRMSGWCTHRLEQIQDNRIIRPAYVTLGSNRTYTPMTER